MLKNLIKIAADLDAAGFKKEADIVDLIIRKVAQSADEADDEIENISDENVHSAVGSEKDLELLLNTEVSEEEREMYDAVMKEVLEEEEEDLPDDLDVFEWRKRQED